MINAEGIHALAKNHANKLDLYERKAETDLHVYQDLP